MEIGNYAEESEKAILSIEATISEMRASVIKNDSLIEEVIEEYENTIFDNEKVIEDLRAENERLTEANESIAKNSNAGYLSITMSKAEISEAICAEYHKAFPFHEIISVKIKNVCDKAAETLYENISDVGESIWLLL